MPKYNSAIDTASLGTGFVYSDGSGALSIGAVNLSGSALIQTQTVSGASEVNFTTGITNAYRNFLLLFDNVSVYYGGAGTGFLTLQLSTDGGATYINTGYIDSTASNMIGMDIESSFLTTADTIGSGCYNIYNLTSGTGYISGGISNSVKFSPTVFTISPGPTINGGYTVPSTVANAFRLVWDSSSANTITGTFSLYGYVD